jgi:hypothetical protein
MLRQTNDLYGYGFYYLPHVCSITPGIDSVEVCVEVNVPLQTNIVFVEYKRNDWYE